MNLMFGLEETAGAVVEGVAFWRRAFLCKGVTSVIPVLLRFGR